MNISSTLFVFCISIGIALSHPGKMHQVMKKCEAENGIKGKLPELIRNGELKEDDDNVKCFHACVMKSFGKMNEDGTVNEDKIGEHIPPHVPNREKFIEASQTCMKEKGKDDCDTAYLIFKCMKDNGAFPGPPPPPPPQ